MQQVMFDRAFNDVPVAAEWLGGQEVSVALGLGGDIDLTRPETLDGLQMAAVTTHIEKYLDEPKRAAAKTDNLSSFRAADRSLLPTEHFEHAA